MTGSKTAGRGISCATALSRTRTLYTISERDEGSELVRRYALFKVGDPACRRDFLTELAALVHRRLGRRLNAPHWLITTCATTELAQEFAEVLQGELHAAAPLPVLAVGPDPCPGSDYTGCDAAARSRIVQSFYYDLAVDLHGRSILIVDDMVTTGTAMAELMRRLRGAGAAPRGIHSFAFVRGLFSLAGSERGVVGKAVDAMTPGRLASIINQPDYYLTSATMLRRMAEGGERQACALRARLLPERQALLAEHIRRYYRKHEVPAALMPFVRTVPAMP